MPEASFRKARLDKSDFSGAIATSVDFGGCKLNLANFSKARLMDSDFRFATLIGANLAGASLKYADLRSADLRETRASGANFWGAEVTKCRMQAATRLVALPYVILSKMIIPFHKKLKKRRELKEKEQLKRVEALVAEQEKSKKRG